MPARGCFRCLVTPAPGMFGRKAPIEPDFASGAAREIPPVRSEARQEAGRDQQPHRPPSQLWVFCRSDYHLATERIAALARTAAIYKDQ